MLRSFFLPAFFLFITSIVNLYANPNTSFILPINDSLKEGERLELTVNIPNGYKALQPKGKFKTDKMAEFIPVSDSDPFKWSKIITVQTMPDSNIDASKLAESIAMKIAKSSPPGKAKLIGMETMDFKDYKAAWVMVNYQYGKRNELLYALYYSGPKDCSGFQYSIALNKGISLKGAIKQIENFVNNDKNIKISKF